MEAGLGSVCTRSPALGREAVCTSLTEDDCWPSCAEWTTCPSEVPSTRLGVRERVVDANLALRLASLAQYADRMRASAGSVSMISRASSRSATAHIKAGGETRPQGEIPLGNGGNGARHSTSKLARLAVSPEEAAETLGISRNHFDRYVLPAIRSVKIGRRRVIRLGELEPGLPSASRCRFVGS